MKKIKASFLGVLLVFSLLLVPSKAEAKGFGTETTTTTTSMGAGQCLETTKTQVKVFWISIQTTYEYNMVAC